MPFKVDVRDGTVRRWTATGDGAEATTDGAYVPSLYVAADPDRLDGLQLRLARDPKVPATGFERRYTSLSAATAGADGGWPPGPDAGGREPVLRVDVERVDEVRTVAREIRCLYERGTHPPGTFRLFDVDLSRQFRYCLDCDLDPTPAADLSVLRLTLDERGLHAEDLSGLRVDGERVGGPGATDRAVLRRVARRVADADPDVLVVSHGDLVALLYGLAGAAGLDGFELGRRPGFERLAGRSTYHSYGRAVHSAPRYDLPGRVLLDRSNSFLYGKTGLAGLLDLVERSGKPLQEVGWASIGTVLTAIESREARREGVLVPWNKWTPEAFKRVATLHEADRGGFVFQPDVGVHRGVREVDFSSLYPAIICEHNVSPETVGCACHDRADVPGLGYSVCEEPGFLPAVLRPLIDAREGLKAGAAGADDPADRADLDARSEAIKWVLVSCFGYQGYRNAKFGRIECHEAINAYARELLLAAKERFEGAGWRVVHGIVDSLWVKPRVADPVPVETVCERVTDAVGIPLEFERSYDWFALVPRRGSREGALNRYVGSHDGGFTVRGIECRQRSTTAFVADAQREMLAALDDDLRPGAAVSVLETRLDVLRGGGVDPADLVVRQRAGERPGEYDRATRTVAALRRARGLDHPVYPGSDVRYVVVDDDAPRERERVRLAFEPVECYDAGFYADRLVRAAESVVSPFGLDEADVRARLERGRDATLAAYR